MKPVLIALFFAFQCPHSGANEGPTAKHQAVLSEAKRVVFLGDSITAAGTYTANFATWAEARLPDLTIDWMNLGLASETVSGLSEERHAGGRFPRPDLHERLGRVLDQTNPDLIFACYGMNCGIYQTLDADRFAKYQEGIQWLKKEAEAAGSRVIFLTPPYYDRLRRPRKQFYTGVLETYSGWLLEQRKNGWLVIDVNSTMRDFINEERKRKPDFSLQPDGVHPDSKGHWVMAQAMIDWFGDTASSEAGSIQEMLQSADQPAEVAGLVEKRMSILHDAWLSATKHKRPGLRPGKPLPEAQELAADLTLQIDQLLER